MMRYFAGILFLSPVSTAELLRGLELDDWHVTIKSVENFGFVFETGTGGGPNPNILIQVNDKCHLEAPASQRKHVGEFYPTSNVQGIDCDDAGIVYHEPGQHGDQSIDFEFVNGINENTDIYTNNEDATATVVFCVEVGFYEDVTMIDFAEIKYTYNIDLQTDVATMVDYHVTHHD